MLFYRFAALIMEVEANFAKDRLTEANDLPMNASGLLRFADR